MTLFSFMYEQLIQPQALSQGLRRQELLLRILLISSLVLSGVALVKNQLSYIRDTAAGVPYDGIALYVIPWIFLGFIGLFLLVRLGFIKSVAYILIGILYAGATATSFYWGVEVPQALITFVLVVVMASVLISTRVAIITSAIVSGTLLIISYLHTNGIVQQDVVWKTQPFRFDDTIALAATIVVITVVSWLSNREIEKSLRRAQASEKALKQERDTLEEKVEERTRELKRTQLEKMLHIYRFAEFGRRASGFFHDLVNPLNVVLLNLEELHKSRNLQRDEDQMAETATFLRRAIEATKRIEQFVLAAQSHVQGRSQKISFSVQHAIEQSMYLLSHKAKEVGVSIVINNTAPDLTVYNEPIKLNQIVTNLVSNAIDSYEGMNVPNKKVVISVRQTDSLLELTIQDKGCGIRPEDMPRIFEPLFTTKRATKGVGLGLSITKDIVEKDFNGTITVRSQSGEGALFTITLPLSQEKN